MEIVSRITHLLSCRDMKVEEVSNACTVPNRMRPPHKISLLVKKPFSYVAAVLCFILCY